MFEGKKVGQMQQLTESEKRFVVLPCTLPLVFIIVPLAMSAGDAKKGLIMAVLFGAGLTITLSI